MLAVLNGLASCPCCLWPLATPRRNASSLSCTTASAVSPVRLVAERQRCGRRDCADLAIENATVIDTLDGSVREDVTVLGADGRILAVEESRAGMTEPAARRIDARGKFVTPGYNDMHSHVLELEDPSGALALMLAEGVTGFRQMSGSPGRLAQRRNATLPIGADAPALLEIPGTVLTPLNAGSPEIAANEVRAQKEQGADFIKVGFVSPEVFGVVMQTARHEGMTVLGHLQDGVDAADAVTSGFRCVEHLGPGTTIWIACSAEEQHLKGEANPLRIRLPPIGMRFLRPLIERRIQLMLINPAAYAPPSRAANLRRAIATFSEAKFETLAALFRADGTWHCPTLVRLRTQALADAAEYDDHPDLTYMPQDRVRRWRKVTRRFESLPVETRRAYAEAYPHQLRLAKALADQGARMMAGTDGGWLAAPGLTLQEEFAELAKAAFTPLQVLQMTTINAARYLGREDEMGTVAPGRNADLVLLDADPLKDVRNLGAIFGVVRAGRYRSRAELDGLRAKVAQNRGYLH